MVGWSMGSKLTLQWDPVKISAAVGPRSVYATLEYLNHEHKLVAIREASMSTISSIHMAQMNRLG
jgi:hypothetical protein